MKHITDHSHIALTLVIHYYFNQDDASALKDLLDSYATYPADLLDRIQFVVVDDGSPIPCRSLPYNALNLNLIHLRIKEDIQWNQGGARNLGITYARSDKVLVTDLDHLFPEKALRFCVNKKLKPKNIFKFWRQNLNGELIGSHANTFMLSRGRFLQLYGYDEEFAGQYGYEDSMFWRWQRNNGTRFHTAPKRYFCCQRKLDRDKSYHSLVRDLSTNQQVAARKREEWAQYGPEAGHSRNFLSFEWEILEDKERQISGKKQRRKHPFWVKSWWWRWLLPH